MITVDSNMEVKAVDEYFCPNCGAILNDQSGFEPSLGSWICTECGQQLMDDDVYDGDTFEGVAWYCDGCGSLLNKQDGFLDSYGSWLCTECGYLNGIGEDDIINGKYFTCPECGTTLNNQIGFDAYDDDWECSSCGAKLTHGYYDDDYSIAEEDKTICPNCDANLEEQWGFSEYDNDWICSECGAKLQRDYSSEEFEIVNESEDEYEFRDDEPEIENVCPVCDSNLKDQYGYDAEYDDWKCECCGTRLHRYLGDYEYSVADEDEVDSADSKRTEYGGYGSYKNNSLNYKKCQVQPQEKAILRKMRLKAFFTSRKRVLVGYDSAQLVGDNYEDVRIRLYNQAFKNIQLKSQKDIYVNSRFADGEVESVVINELMTFSASDMFPFDSEIIITYHEKREITISFSNGNIRKNNYYEIQKQLMGMGFANVTTLPIKDLTTGWIKKDGSIETVKINNKTDYKKGTIFKYDVPIVIEYHTFKKERHTEGK